MSVPASNEPTQPQEQLFAAHYLDLQVGAWQRALKRLAEVNFDELPAAERVNYLRIKGEAYFLGGEYELARQTLVEAVEQAGNYPDATTTPLEMAQLYNVLGLTYYCQNNHLTAIKYHELCREAVDKGYVNNPRFKMKLYSNLGNEYLGLGKIPEAEHYYRLAVALADENGEDDLNRANIYWGVGLLYRQVENYPLATHHFRRALAIYTRVGESGRRYVAGMRVMLGWVLIELAEYEDAQKELLAAQAQITAEQGTDSVELAFVSLNLGYLHYKRDKTEAALQICEEYTLQGLELARLHNDRQTLGLGLAQLAETKLAQNCEASVAKELFEQALAHLQEIGSVEYTRQVNNRYAKALYKAGFVDEAFSVKEKAYRYLAG